MKPTWVYLKNANFWEHLQVSHHINCGMKKKLYEFKSTFPSEDVAPTTRTSNCLYSDAINVCQAFEKSKAHPPKYSQKYGYNYYSKQMNIEGKICLFYVSDHTCISSVTHFCSLPQCCQPYDLWVISSPLFTGLIEYSDSRVYIIK